MPWHISYAINPVDLLTPSPLLDPTAFPSALNPNNDIILAYEMAGDELSRDRGFPVRAILPGYIGVGGWGGVGGD